MRLSILVWDPSSPIQLPLPICEIPFHRSDFDGQMLLAIMDEYLYHASSYVTGIIFDAASAHQCFRRAMMGIPNQDDMILLQNKNFKFFPFLRYQNVPCDTSSTSTFSGQDHVL